FGPVIITEQDWHLGLGYSAIKFKLSAAEVDDEIINLINEKLHLGALLSFNKDVTTFIKTDEMSYQDGETIIVSAPAEAEFSLINNETIIGDFSWGGLEVKGEGERFVIGTVAMSTEQQVVSGDYLQGTAILTGDATFNVTNIDMYSQKIHVFSLSEAGLTSVVSLDDELLALKLKYHAKEVSASGQNFEQPNLEVVLANIDINALQELNKLSAKLSIDVAGQDYSAELLAALSAVADQILAKEPKLTVTDLSVVTEQGKIASEFALNINKDLFDFNSVNSNSMALIMALEADAKGSAPMEFLTQFGMAPMVDDFVAQGYLTKQDNDVSFVAKYVESQLTINGKAFQL
ncbi:MAG: YdgA family protein, partial [Colwellia sp.]|nr:YdgA family protein [Colwellia sp.]